MNVMRILVADDHAVLRTGLCLLLDDQPDMEVVGEAGDGVEALTFAESLQPDLILLDLTMPGLGGLEALPLLKKTAPNSQILVLTMHDDESYFRQAIQSGASGYILKRAVYSELLNAIRAVARGEIYVHSAMTNKLLDDVLPGHIASKSHDNPWDALSKREFEVLRLVALGHTSAEIADQLSVSTKTVETYRARGMQKLELNTRAQLVRAALTQGILD
jgi:DNA-binding NarL/FixJ family response regulator